MYANMRLKERCQLLELGENQYKPATTVIDVIDYFKNLIFEKLCSIFTSIAFFILGILGTSIYTALNNKSINVFNTTDWWLLVGAIVFLLAAIIWYFLVEVPTKETIDKYRTKNIKLRNNYFNQIKLLKLEQLKKQEIDIQSFWHDLLSVISKAYDFTSNERLSLFVIEEDKKYQQETSIMFGRYSENRDYNKKNRGVHPINQGCIGLAWNSPENYFFKNDFPENNKDYCNNLRTCYKFSEEVIDNFRMKARTIGCVVLHNLTNTDKVAVLVFESTDRKSKILTEKTMLAIYKEYKAEFQSIIDSLKDYIPLISVDNELEENQ